MQDYEKLGAFYLGRPYDPVARTAREGFVLYDSKDLLTHAVCVGMTGSGKTGLCIGVLEEAAIDGIPAIVIDPKGDLGNLLFQFPELAPDDYAPWIDPAEAERAGVTVDSLAARTAETWRAGLAASGQDGERIRRLAESAEIALYTPGSTAGIPVSILDSFGAPPQAVRDDEELLQERVRTTASGLLGLLGVDADPIQSREHILLSTLFASAWRAGDPLDLGALIQSIQTPPFAQVGVLDLESFFPAKERFQLAARLNNLLASPSFAAWLQGEPLDVGAALRTRAGKPRIAIYSIAHLADAERMFFVTLLLSEVLGWVRSQPGTGSLRAILFLDEIFGYLPPVANPPSKEPLLLLLKQARAYGLGLVLATQNPVDLDYKALSNAGTWWIGRLQTERDKLRMLEGLESVARGTGGAQAFDRTRIDALLSGLEKRVFLMHDVHEDEPVVFQTRFTLSWLRGPLTRAEIKRLSAAHRVALAPGVETASSAAGSNAAGSNEPASADRPRARPEPPAIPPPAPQATRSTSESRASHAGSSDPEATRTLRASRAPSAAARPVVAPAVPQFFLHPRGARPDGAELVYEPALLGLARVYFRDAKRGVDAERPLGLLDPLSGSASLVDWARAETLAIDEAALASEPAPGARFAELPAQAAQAKSYDAWRRAFVDHVTRTTRLELLRSARLGLSSAPDETERAFRARLAHAGREERDLEVEKLRRKYAPKLATLAERKRRAAQAVEREEAQAREAKLGTAISFGSTLLGAFLGRKVASAGNVGRAASTARGVGRSLRQSEDVERAGETLAAVEQQIAELDGLFREEVAALEARTSGEGEVLETLSVSPKKTNVAVRAVALVWIPHWDTGERRLRAI